MVLPRHLVGALTGHFLFRIRRWELRRWELSWACLHARRNGIREFLEDAVANTGQRPDRLESRGVLVAAAAVARGDRPDVDVVLRAHAHVDVSVGPQLEEHHGL